MIPGADKYYQCPICTTTVYKPSLLSGNTFGAQLYSDGKRDAPMLPEFPTITACPNCEHIYWLNDQSSCSVQDPSNAERAEFLNVIEFDKAIKLGLAQDRADEVFLRQRMVWSFNDRVREGWDMLPTIEMKQLWEENRLRLMEILDTDNINEKILLSELHRYAGEFDECLCILESLEVPELDWLVDAFKTEVSNRNIKVFEFKLD